ncbi:MULTISPECIES: pro-sigmaK processing inhibitor BofA family protein [Selenomonas]|jgi:inhibitor of the pro-sigma K processing machinery|uniref:Transcriptional regulator n=1 Tax=Selenomonas ruminis TaxID=2593411 RepID=A0A5D6W7U6_9FIRM|nr:MULTISPECIES: pro-sigmaK processing inhibitor BofA family protein [unclassified Selenomonas]TYZ23850.1 transcriptional regulator [Selenomonas sp. mPRGC5]
MEIVAAFAVGLIVLCLIGKIVALPMKLLWKMITNSLVGVVLLWVVNLFGAGVKITFLKALIAGVLGVPGVIIVLLMK